MHFKARPFLDWKELRALRLRSLQDSAEWFAARLEIESAKSKEEWDRDLSESHWRVLIAGESLIGMMAVSAAEASRNCDCWLFGCWIEPSFRGQGGMDLIIEEMDRICMDEGWRKQGLGVWPNNHRAIRAYKRYGFYEGGEPRPSRSRPGQMYLPMFRILPNF